ncbi:MAG: ester cyclase [Sciscionella sp.]
MAEAAEVFRRYIEQAVNKSDLDLVAELIDDDCVIARGGTQRASGLLTGTAQCMAVTAEATAAHNVRQTAARAFAAGGGLDENQPISGGIEAMRLAISALRKVFPDYTHEIKELVADGDRVAYRLHLRATHEGEFLGVPATHRLLEMDEVGHATVRKYCGAHGTVRSRHGGSPRRSVPHLRLREADLNARHTVETSYLLPSPESPTDC